MFRTKIKNEKTAEPNWPDIELYVTSMSRNGMLNITFNQELIIPSELK
jgi:hypothetical protein